MPPVSKLEHREITIGAGWCETRVPVIKEVEELAPVGGLGSAAAKLGLKRTTLLAKTS